MLIVCHRYLVSAAATAVLVIWGTNASSITTAPASTPTIAPTCEYRTINYITDSLPQLCFKSSWSHSNGTSAPSAQVADPTVTGKEATESTSISDTKDGHTIPSTTQGGSDETPPAAQTSILSIIPTASEAADASVADLESGELNDSSFLSFEEWKKQTLEKAGQADANIGKKRAMDGKKRDSASFQNHLDSIGDEGEIDIDIGFGSGGRDGGQRDGELEAGETAGVQDKVEKEEKSKDQHRSKDAGRTCKERFSYASFDAGATILKTHPGAKNAKAVLIENKDSYMRSECSVQNKFIIVELSEDIWIDTVVLANYEFFSSMFRHFRVSLSDKYPVKIDKWKDVGTYEARNSRHIQAFLVENPQIWARYMRIEFLSHYGNEYYCPLSLVRVHGTRMLESWRESEAIAEDEENDDSDVVNEEEFIHEAVAESVQEEERVAAELKDAQLQNEEKATSPGAAVDVSSLEDQAQTSLWEREEMFSFFALDHTKFAEDICLLSEAPAQEIVSQKSTNMESNPPSALNQDTSSSLAATGTNNAESFATSTRSSNQKPTTMDISSTKNSSSSSISSEKAAPRSDTPTSTSSTTKVQNSTNSVKTKTSSTSSASSSLPTIQESFFKAVSRRLNFLETNSTLSLKYIEEQSRILREAFTRVEKKQMQKTTVFLETLNSTMLDELRGFRQQYDEIWQSTVISLESQREASRKEFLAISSRLNILADEVVFQKRMSIVQSVLLLLCLGLVIFSRVSGSGNNLDMSYLQGRVKSMYGYSLESPIESPLDSPAYHRTRSLREGRWLDVNNHKRQRSDDLPISQSRSRENSPPTPISTYSRDDVALTPPSGIDGDGTAELMLPQVLDLSAEDQLASKRSSYHSTTSPPEEPDSPPSSPIPIRSPKRRKPFVRQQFSPPREEENWPLSSDLSPPSSEIRPRLSSQHLHPRLSGQYRQERDEEAVDEERVEDIEDDETTQIPIIHLPSPPPESRHADDNSGGTLRSSFSISRKPLPALPPQDTGS